MKRRINRRNGVGILMAAVVAAGSLQVPALAQVEAAESVPVVETTTLEDGNLGAASSQGAQLNFSNIGATYNVKDYGASTSLDDNYPAFQAALDAANKYQKKHPGSQCKVVIPKGTYRIKGESAWNAASVSGPNDDGSRTALISPDWTTGTNEARLTIHSVDPKTGIFARKSYEYQLLADGATVASGEFTPKNNNGDVIPNAGMESWSTKSMKKMFSGSANVPYPNAYMTSSGTDKLCTQATYPGMVGDYCAQLAAKYAVIAFAAGNLYTGDFVMDGTVGYAQFGQPYTYSARPAALKLKYAAEIGEINRVKNDPPVSTGIDKGRIFVCIVEWSDRHAVQSGTTVDKTTFWDPETVSSLNEGKIIGYGSAYITESHTGSMKDLELPIVYYEKTDKAPTSKYTLVISTATSYLGDYLTGCDTNKLWVDDFEWVY